MATNHHMTDRAATGAAVAPALPRRRGTGARLAGLGFAAVVLGLVGLNGWWLVRETWPLADLKAVAAWVGQGRYGEAEEALREHLRRSPHHGEARMLRARLRILRGDRLGGAAELHRVPDWWPAKREALFAEGQAYRSLDRARPAEEAWRACVKDDPLHPTRSEYFVGAAEGLLEVFAPEARMDEARAVLWELYPQVATRDRPMVLNKWLQTHLLRVEARDAVPLLRRFVQADPADGAARRGLALLAQAAGDDAEADRQLSAALAVRPDDVATWRVRLETLATRGDQAGLLAAVQGLPATAAADPVIWGYRGRALQAAGDLRGAAGAFGRALEWRPFDEELYYRLSQVERRLGATARADADLRRSQSLRATRVQIAPAAEAFRTAFQEDNRRDMAAAAGRLASLCEALGWPHAAEAWAALARSP